MRILYLIPARAGSKGLLGKNTKLLQGKPLVQYTIEFALATANTHDEICISTNDDEVIPIAEKLGIQPPFKRPEHLATDTASSYEVIMHALAYYKTQNKIFDAVLLLQPTSPFRQIADFNKLIAQFDEHCDMVVSVKEAKENPYFTLFEENTEGFLTKSKEGHFKRRQDCPKVYAYNGAMYLMRVKALEEKEISAFMQIKKILMPTERSIDIDTEADWVLAEYFAAINNKFANN
ncbi:cytidylyltransferase domain-containing protein [Pedobacter glucosidilyticus]|uniref:acylneuraminate cytidylyltransferase family protein n=1 Tax=Pedobacter glucosidilyticus TaxID=1122941 RepID=UPI00041F638F|nr:acylneuraminate cytidylyltransferase family protein [Pedobacter glucosidilyticus]